MRVLVVGAGSIGTLIAALLARGKADVLLLAHRASTAERINERGICVDGVSGCWQARVRACSDAGQAKGCDLAIVCVKAYDTVTVAPALKPVLRGGACVVTLQNGMGNIEILQDALGDERVIGGTTSMGAVLVEPGKVRHAGEGETVIGRPDGKMPVAMRSVRETFNRAGIETKISRDIKGALWSKLLINAAVNPLSALTRLANGKLVEYEATKVLLRLAVTECVKVAKRKKVRLMYDDPLAKVEAVCAATSSNLSSMLQDVVRGKRTEIDFINGFIVRQGQELGIPVPVNTVLWELVKTVEASYGAAVGP